MHWQSLSGTSPVTTMQHKSYRWLSSDTQGLFAVPTAVRMMGTAVHEVTGMQCTLVTAVTSGSLGF